LTGCQNTKTAEPTAPSPDFLSAPLVSHMHTADPSAHVFEGKIYVYPSHDRESGKPAGGADQFDMKDYHVFSMDEVGGPVTDHGMALHVDDVPWATRQMWAPDAAHKDGKYYLYFPAKDKDDIFRIGVAVAELTPKIAKMSDDMLSFAEPLRDVQILDEQGQPILAGDNDRRFFEAAWVHKYEGVYYFSYSTGDTHFIQYATGSSPYGPFTYQGKILEPVLGWTNHHSIVQHNDKWYLFYHDSEISEGKTYLRNMHLVK